jgi:hypothetical protein
MDRPEDRHAAAQLSARSLRPGRSAESRRTATVALASNVTIAIAKIVAGALSGSAAMLAEAAHSLADTANQTFLLISIGLSERPPIGSSASPTRSTPVCARWSRTSPRSSSTRRHPTEAQAGPPAHADSPRRRYVASAGA